MKKLLALSALALVLTGCKEPPKPGTLTGQTGGPVQVSPRFTVVLQQVFDDDIAYGDVRGIYVMTDTKTGKEYVGISGVGISELGNHSTGKSAVPDER